MRPWIIALLLLPGLALARPPAKKDVDNTLLRIPTENLGPLREAEGRVREDHDAVDRYESESKWAQLDARAAKAWVDAGKAIVKALKADAASAEAWARVDDQAKLAAQITRAEANLRWREARMEEAQAFNDFQGTRQTWARAQLDQDEVEVDHQRMTAYNDKVGGSADAQVEIGKLQQQLGKKAKTAGKARQRMDKAEHTWRTAVAASTALAPPSDTAQ